MDLRRPHRKRGNQRRRHAVERQHSHRPSVRRQRDYPDKKVVVNGDPAVLRVVNIVTGIMDREFVLPTGP